MFSRLEVNRLMLVAKDSANPGSYET